MICKFLRRFLVRVLSSNNDLRQCHQDRRLRRLEYAEWHPIVHLYQQYNQTNETASRLSPWIVVMLARDTDGGSSGLGGVAADSATYLGNSYLDLYGYGPILHVLMDACCFLRVQRLHWGLMATRLVPASKSYFQCHSRDFR